MAGLKKRLATTEALVPTPISLKEALDLFAAHLTED